LIPRPRALLIDGAACLYRGYFAIRSLIGRDGSQVNAVYGFLREVVELLDTWRPEYAAAAFDLPGAVTFRHRLFAGYKRDRPVMPERLAAQLDLALDAARALGVPALTLKDWEADDILATLVRQLGDRDVACLVVAADKDLAQLVRPGVWLLTPGQPDPQDSDAVRSRYGVLPERMPDLLALRGDAIDGVSGVPGIGERTALRLLRTPSPLHALWEAPEALEGLGLKNPIAVFQSLRGGRSTFERNRKLTTLHDDLPLGLSLEALVYKGVDAARIRALSERFGFDRLQDRIGVLAAHYGRRTGLLTSEPRVEAE
jgi:DNA polymerase-1